MARTTKARLGIDALEARDCPALPVGGDGYCGTPWPAPRASADLAAVRVTVVAAGVASVTLDPATVRAFNPQPDPPGTAGGIIAINPGVVRGA